MKKAILLLIAVLAFLFVSSPVYSQDSGDKDYKFTIKTNPLSALGGPIYVLWVVAVTAEYKLSFEARTFEKQSVQIGAGFLGSSPLLYSIGSLEESGDTTAVARGFRGQLWYKFFLTDEVAPNGFYVGPHVSYAFAKLMNSEVRDKYVSAAKLQVHVALGYQLITKGGFALDIFTGIGIKNKSYSFSNQSTGGFFDDFELKNKFTVSVPLGFTFGYAF